MRQGHLLKSQDCIIVMGVAGTGKTTVGKALAERLGGSFLDADELHPQANISKMRKGEPLEDADRMPWLEAVAEHAARHRGNRPLVIACSALKEAYRAKLARIRPAFVYLQAERGEIERRLQSRTGHYFPAGLLASQFDDLEEPQDALVVPVAWPVQRVVEHIAANI